MTALLTENLPLLAGAPNGIKKLRELILELAVRGKLVEQNVSDEPASELLKRIAAEKTRLVAEGKIKKQKPLANIGEEEKLFELPSSWVWARLGEVTLKITDGTHHSPTNTQCGDYRYISAKNIKSWGIDLSEITYVTNEIHQEIFSRCDPSKGDVLYIKDGATTGIATINPLDEPFSMLSSVALLKPSAGLHNEYLLKAMVSPIFYREMRAGMTGVAITRVTLAKLNNAIIPLPPLAEQHHIVTKVDELMALCDRLEAQQAYADSAHAQLVQALLGSLTQISDATEFAANWQRLAEHFHTLFTTEPSIDALKQTLLQLAVMGKLVPQDPSDEPAGELLMRLAKDRSDYAAAHKVAVPKPESISASEQRLTLPRGWAWTRLCSMFRVITDGDHQPPPKSTDGIAFLTIGNVTKGRLDFSNCRFVPQDYFDQVALYRRPEIGDILYTVVGATYGRPIAVDSSRDFCVQRHIAILKNSELLSSSFACYLLSSPWIYEQATQSTTGTAQPTIPLRPLRNFLVMLPPLAEQHRIVAKVDQLMALCDQLKTRLTQARRLNEQLASTLVEQAVA